jgi:hypothetical protein
MEGTSAAEAAHHSCQLYRSGGTAAPPKGEKMFAVSQFETEGLTFFVGQPLHGNVSDNN